MHSSWQQLSLCLWGPLLLSPQVEVVMVTPSHKLWIMTLSARPKGTGNKCPGKEDANIEVVMVLVAVRYACISAGKSSSRASNRRDARLLIMDA